MQAKSLALSKLDGNCRAIFTNNAERQTSAYATEASGKRPTRSASRDVPGGREFDHSRR
jgi:hypothetical protein